MLFARPFMDGLIFVVGLLRHFGDAFLDEAALGLNGGIAVFADGLQARFETVEFLLVAVRKYNHIDVAKVSVG